MWILSRKCILGYSYAMEQLPLKETWLRNGPEERLAALQQNQGRSNNCGEFAAAAALNVLFGLSLAGQDMADFADRGWFRHGLRTWPGGATTPQQQARLVRVYAREHGLALEASAGWGNQMQLRSFLANPGLACLVTIAWDNRLPPRIQRKGMDIPRVSKSPFFWSGHTMLLAAFRPALPAEGKYQNCWGFVNSWDDGGDGIFWMDADEFERCWGYPLFPIGAHNVVVVRKLK